MAGDDSLMFDKVPCHEKVTIGDGRKVNATHKGVLKVTIVKEDGQVFCLNLKNVLYIPSLVFNLISIQVRL